MLPVLRIAIPGLQCDSRGTATSHLSIPHMSQQWTLRKRTRTHTVGNRKQWQHAVRHSTASFLHPSFWHTNFHHAFRARIQGGHQGEIRSQSGILLPQNCFAYKEEVPLFPVCSLIFGPFSSSWGWSQKIIIFKQEERPHQSQSMSGLWPRAFSLQDGKKINWCLTHQVYQIWVIFFVLFWHPNLYTNKRRNKNNSKWEANNDWHHWWFKAMYFIYENITLKEYRITLTYNYENTNEVHLSTERKRKLIPQCKDDQNNGI